MTKHLQSTHGIVLKLLFSARTDLNKVNSDLLRAQMFSDHNTWLEVRHLQDEASTLVRHIDEKMRSIKNTQIQGVSAL